MATSITVPQITIEFSRLRSAQTKIQAICQNHAGAPAPDWAVFLRQALPVIELLATVTQAGSDTGWTFGNGEEENIDLVLACFVNDV